MAIDFLLFFLDGPNLFEAVIMNDECLILKKPSLTSSPSKILQITNINIPIFKDQYGYQKNVSKINLYHFLQYKIKNFYSNRIDR